MMVATETDDDRNEEPIPLLHLGAPSPLVDDDFFQSNETVNSSSKRSGNTWTAAAHIITGVIGSGVLSLAWSMAQLGWIWGPILMFLFASITLFSSFLICNCYRSPDPDYGKTNARICGLLIQMNLYGTGIAYTITTAICLRCFVVLSVTR